MAKPKEVIRQIKKATRRQFSAEEKIRIVLEGLRGKTGGRSRTVLIREMNVAPVLYSRDNGFDRNQSVKIFWTSLTSQLGRTAPAVKALPK